LQECRCSPYHTQSAFFPLIDLLQRKLHWQSEDTPDEKLHKLETVLVQTHLDVAKVVPLFTPLLALPLPDDRYPTLSLSSQRHRQQTMEALVMIFLEAAAQHPVVFIVEDLHWIDPSTLEFLDLLINQVPTASILTLLTCRPAFLPQWGSHSYLIHLTLNRLSRNQIAQMAERVAGGKSLPAEVLQQIVAKTDGVPLFVEEMTKVILESGHLKEITGDYELTGTLPSLAIPSTLQDSLMARLDRLVTAKGIAQFGAVIGRQFTYELLHAVSPVDEETLQRELGRLVEAELLYQRGLPPHATYVFKHALVRDEAYESLLKRTRQQYHQWIAHVLEDRFPATTETQPELLAHHYAEAGLSEQAVGYWQRAGERAIERSAYVEAISQLTKALELLTTLPKTSERTQQELVLLTTLGPVVRDVKGDGSMDVKHVYTRARELCQDRGDPPQLFWVLRGLYSFYAVRAEYQAARDLGEQLLTLAQRHQDPTLLLEAHRALGLTLFYLGEFVPSRAHLEQGIALYDPQQHRSLAFHLGLDLGVACVSPAAWALWMLGYPDQALQRSQEALILAQEVSHPYTLGWALNWAARLHQCRREEQTVQEHAEGAIALCTEQGFALYAAGGTIMQGWALAAQGHGEEGTTQVYQSLTAWRATGAEVVMPYFLALLAEVYGKAEQAKEGRHVLTEALALVDKTGERFYEAELYRLKGELLLRQATPDTHQAETCFQQAIAIAQRQSAKSWELRAATSLARLWQRQGKRQDAYDLLAPVYEWFTEGFDTADLKEAKTLLQELA
jgi:predicted ATPase